MIDKYFSFLYEIISRDFEKSHSLLMQHLHGIPFYSIIPNDENRGEDGKKLRDIFNKERPNIGLSLCSDDPCTMLEMLIGLSFRMENELKGGAYEMPVKECFWTLINNLDLFWCNDDEFKKWPTPKLVSDRIKILLERWYERDGHGGLFPLKYKIMPVGKDQRQVEIWYQMSEWLLENFEF